jgi:hypothetical protein
MKRLIFALALLTATPAVAKDVTITLNDQEQKVFLALLDVALKQGGLSNLQAVTQFVQKYQQAAGPAAAPAAPAPAAPAKPEEPKK